MTQSNLFPSWPPEPRSAHLLGVGGSGMRALAEFFADLGWTVTGEDSNPDSLSNWPTRAGVTIVSSDEADRAAARRSADVVIRSAAITECVSRVDAEAAYWTYPEVLAEISRATSTVAVAGTHGKTTSATLLSLALANGSRLVGGEHRGDRRHGRWSKAGDQTVVLEACEYRNHFLDLSPRAACILNLEWDHPDHYRSEAETVEMFRSFVSRLPATVPILIEHKTHQRFFSDFPANVFDVEPCTGFWPRDVAPYEDGLRFDLTCGGERICHFDVPHLSEIFLGNAVAAAGMAILLGRDATAVADGLASFEGVTRRFEVVRRGPTIFVDDYAHHPTAVRMAIATIRRRWPRHRVVAVFEPHQAGRLRAFASGFADALNRADEVIIAPVFAARETETDESAVSLLTNQLSTPYFAADNLDQVSNWLETRLQHDPEAVVAVFGAGQIGRILDE